MKMLYEHLSRLNESPCEEGLAWATKMTGEGYTMQQMWQASPRGDWMLWLAARINRAAAEVHLIERHLALHLIRFCRAQPFDFTYNSARWNFQYLLNDNSCTCPVVYHLHDDTTLSDALRDRLLREIADIIRYHIPDLDVFFAENIEESEVAYRG